MRAVIAVGGNAILTKDASAEGQCDALHDMCKHLCDMAAKGWDMVISHGNGPQVGNLYLQQKATESAANPAMPMDTCVAMTQGSIGYWLQNAMQEELNRRRIRRNVVSLVTQVEVDPKDDAFKLPTKPIGPFLSEEEARKEMEMGNGTFAEDSGRGWRKVVPSPKPLNIVEANAIDQLLTPNNIVVCGGGGGIPVIRYGLGYKGVEAVIDKDFATEVMAEQIEADLFIILTGVPHVCINYGKPEQKDLTFVTTSELKQYIEEKQFPAGSMLPKVEAAMLFAESKPGRKTIITTIESLANYKDGDGTEVVMG